MIRACSLLVVVLILGGCGGDPVAPLDPLKAVNAKAEQSTKEDVAKVDAEVAKGADGTEVRNERIAELNGEICVLQAQNQQQEAKDEKTRQNFLKKIVMIVSGALIVAAIGCAIAAVFTGLRRLWLLTAAFGAGLVVAQTTNVVLNHLGLFCGCAGVAGVLAALWASRHHGSVQAELDVAKAEVNALRQKVA